MRGTPATPMLTTCRIGIIPAHAGNTRVRSGRARRLSDHPRACGEHNMRSYQYWMYRGSSPRMRGTLGISMFSHTNDGIIPAHTGNTSTAMWASACSRDHPRACGEHVGLKLAAVPLSGSSPRMRGTRRRAELMRGGYGIIPAHAGNTCCLHAQSSTHRDHPRACGEHITRTFPAHYGRGSSPRMRGTRIMALSGTITGGIIPAHAGNTCLEAPSHFRQEDHPRACGEHGALHCPAPPRPGSSPRMRGTLPFADRDVDCLGIIPAHAGNTSRLREFRRTRRDHPRACGEHFPIVACCGMAWGSSPRMRGTRKDSPLRRCHSGIIPAHAGSTFHGS